MGKMNPILSNLAIRTATLVRKLPLRHLGVIALVVVASSLVLHAGPIADGVKKGTDEAGQVGKYIGGAVSAGLTLIGGGRVTYKVIHEKEDWGASLGMALVGLAIGAVALAV